jgi:ribose 5-phosphate isomerase B
MSIAANRFKGIRAANCDSVIMARQCRLHNNANILTLGERVLSAYLVIPIVDAFFNNEFEGDRHIERIRLLDTLN